MICNRRLHTASTALLLALAFGCGSSPQDETAEALIESAAKQSGEPIDVEVDSSGDAPYSMKMTTDEGQIEIKSNDSESGESYTIEMKNEEGVVKLATGADASVPASFPADIPLPPELEVRVAHELAEKQQYNLQLFASMPLSDVGNFFVSELAEQGWTRNSGIEHSGGDQPMKMLTYEKDDRVVNIIITVEGEGSVINLTTTQK